MARLMLNASTLLHKPSDDLLHFIPISPRLTLLDLHRSIEDSMSLCQIDHSSNWKNKHGFLSPVLTIFRWKCSCGYLPSLLERPLYARPIANTTNPSLDSVLIHQRKKWKLLRFLFTNHLRVDSVQNLTHLPVWKQRTWKWEFKSSWLVEFLQAPLNMKHPRNTVNVTPDMFITRGHIPWYMFN